MGVLRVVGMCVFGCAAWTLSACAPAPAAGGETTEPEASTPSEPARETPASGPTEVPADVSVSAPGLRYGEGRVFFCRTRSGKTIELHDDGATIRYVFSSANGKPEMDLVVPRERASTTPWDGYTNYISYAVHVPNGNTVYTVFRTADRRIDSEVPVWGGVRVDVDDRTVADVECVPDSVEGSLEDMDLRVERSWNTDA